MATHFASYFGNDDLNNNDVIIALHLNAIHYALKGKDPNDLIGPPPYVTFLEIAAEFIGKLKNRKDKHFLLMVREVDLFVHEYIFIIVAVNLA